MLETLDLKEKKACLLLQDKASNSIEHSAIQNNDKELQAAIYKYFIKNF